MWAFACAQTFVGLIASFFSIQLLLNVANGPYQAFIPDHVGRRRQGMASAWMGLMQLLGEAGGPVLAGLMLGTKLALANPDTAIRQIMLITSAMMLVALAVTLIFVPDKPADDPLPPRIALKELLDIRPQDHPDFFRLLVSRTVFNLGFYVAVDFLKFYVQDSLRMSGKAESSDRKSVV